MDTQTRETAPNPLRPIKIKNIPPATREIVTALAALVALTGSALADGVASRNVVGYQTVSLTANQYSMIGTTFTSVGEDSSVATLGEFLDASQLTTGATILKLKDDGSYSTYSYVDAEAAEEEEIDVGWYDENGDLINSGEFENGIGFWILPQNTADVQLKGEVKSTWTYTATAGQYTMLSFPFPIDYKFDDFTYTGNTGDTILMVKADGSYAPYSYVDPVVAEEEEIDTGWYDEDGELATTTFTASQGFWLLPVDGGSDAIISASL